MRITSEAHLDPVHGAAPPSALPEPTQAVGGLPVASMTEFHELFDRERTPMVRLAYLMVGAEALAEEVVQDAFTTVYLRWSTLDNPGGYLRRCVVNGANRQLRRRKLERRKLAAVVDEPVDLEARELLDALAALRPAWRAVVVLRFYEGLTQGEIAEVLDMKPGTVKSSLHRALEQLRKEIER